MTKKTQRTRVDRSESRSYAQAGLQYFEIAEVAHGKRYWNPAGVLLVHAAIAFADAVCIHLMGEKSTSANHLDAVHLLDEATQRVKGQAAAVTHLKRVIERKTEVSYEGLSTREPDLEALLDHTEKLRTFAEGVLRA